MKRSALLLAALAWASIVSGIAQTKVATTAAQFLGISVGPKALGMGSAYVAQATDATALYWNPGGLALSGQSMVSFSNTKWLAGSNFRWLGAAISFDGVNVVGMSITQLDYGQEEITTVSAPDGTGQLWSAEDLSIGLTYSRRLTDRFSFGATAKYVSQTIANESARTLTFDAGLLFVTGFNGMRLGMSITNFGGDLSMDGRDLLNRIDIDPANAGSNKTLVGKRKTDAWPTPVFFRVGLAMDVAPSEGLDVTVAIDAVRPNDNQMTLNGGVEVTILDLFQLRGGYKSMLGAGSRPFSSETAFGSKTTLEGLSVGAGVQYGLEGMGTLELQYAYNQFGLFGNLNTFAVSYSF